MNALKTIEASYRKNAYFKVMIDEVGKRIADGENPFAAFSHALNSAQDVILRPTVKQPVAFKPKPAVKKLGESAIGKVLTKKISSATLPLQTKINAIEALNSPKETVTVKSKIAEAVLAAAAAKKAAVKTVKIKERVEGDAGLTVHDA